MKLEISSLVWSVGGRNIVDGVSLQVEEKGSVAVIGPNGSGKSSMLRCIYGANTPTGGSIKIDGADVAAMSRREFALRAAAVPQEMPTQFDFSVREMVAMGRYPHKRALDGEDANDRSAIERALEHVGMAARAGRMFSSLSGGEKQRTLIARAIAQQCDLMLLDEPTNHLDIFYQLEIMELLRATGVSRLIVMHDLELAARYCDRICVMKDGRVAAEGTPREVLTPEMIREVYRVEADVRTTDEGEITVSYKRARR